MVKNSFVEKKPTNDRKNDSRTKDDKKISEQKKLPALQKKNYRKQSKTDNKVKATVDVHSQDDKKNVYDDKLKARKASAKNTFSKKAATAKNLKKSGVRGQNVKESAVPEIKYDANAKIRIIPLGGLNEIGKNMTAIECNDDIIVIDCGLAFPDEEMPGVDLVIPDVTYLEANASRVRGIVLTHGHEDHIGAIPYVLRNINPPIYGTRLTVGIIRNKLKEFSLNVEPKLIEVKAGDVIRLGGMSVEFIHVNHSIADACALAIKTPLGTIVHSGDFKLDLTPIDGEIMDITRLGELGNEGVLLLMCESTNAERPGHTPSERKVGASLEYIFTTHKKQRIVIATFSSNVHRVQQIIDAAARHG